MEFNVIGFAREELTKYLDRLQVKADIRLGLFSDFGIDLKVEQPVYDDAVAISVKDKKGYIAGSNERSVLIGVYRLLAEWGIGWVRPGKNGTYYPKICTAPDVEILEAAENRHRTVCIEGANRIENILDMIDWMPKVGLNSYYIQFSLPYEFFERWYSHRHNPLKAPEPFTVEMAEEYHRRMVREIKRRGLLLHAVGHGWPCAPFGVSDHGWYKPDPESIPQAYKDICALVGGERKVWRNTPLATQLCYSDPYVRKTIVNAVIKYIEDHPEADVVHFWLGDYFNNTCECENCVKDTYSDHYVRMVNDVTDVLVSRGLCTKVVFLLCYNTSHPPKKERIKHPENAVLLFAPISRTFAESFPRRYAETEIPPYETNAFDLVYGKPASVNANLAYLHAWKQCCDVDTADFDYHLMWDHILDAGGEGIAKILYEDIRSFAGLGINGLVSCQLQRNAFPTSAAMTVMAKTLWNTAVSFDAVRRALYAAAFGEDTVDVLCDYFSALSAAFDIASIRGQREGGRDKFRSNMEEALRKMERFGETIAANVRREDACQKESWELLELHRLAYLSVGRAIIEKLDGDEALGDERIKEAYMFVFEKEDRLRDVLDSMYFYRMTKERITVNQISAFTVV